VIHPGRADAAAPRAAGDPVATLTAPATVVEGTAGTSFLAAHIVLDVPAPASFTLQFATVDGTASSAGGADFQSQSVGVTFLAGATGPATINIAITTDDLDEPDETFSMVLAPVTGGVTVDTTPVTTTIVDDDEPLVATLSAPATIVEGTGGTTFVVASIALNRPTLVSRSVHLVTVDGSATSAASADFTAIVVDVTFLGGSIGPANINFAIAADILIESNETFSFVLSTLSADLTVRRF